MSNLAHDPMASASTNDAEPIEPARHRRGAPWIRGLVLIALATSVYYFSWWGGGGRIASPLLALALLLAGVYHWAQIFSSWVIYLAAARRPAPRQDLPVVWPTIDVFVTACGESADLVERALGAAVRMRGEHRTWLLDDGDDPSLERLSQRLGAGYLTREGSKDSKAGNLNAALSRTDGEIVVIFDVDHAPEPDFLQRSVGPFSDADVGFVQVMLTFANDRETWFSRAASESCLDFFNPTSIGMDGLGGATLIGSNALIRRRALESIGGYKPGLAEDLATSLALHAGGWRSVYVAEPLAPGLAPADLNAWFTQQFKWARGVFEVLLTAYPRLVGRLSWGQRLSYGVRTTYYWVGCVSSFRGRTLPVARRGAGLRDVARLRTGLGDGDAEDAATLPRHAQGTGRDASSGLARAAAGRRGAAGHRSALRRGAFAAPARDPGRLLCAAGPAAGGRAVAGSPSGSGSAGPALGNRGGIVLFLALAADRVRETRLGVLGEVALEPVPGVLVVADALAVHADR
jgi:hypothetical protein